MNEINSGAVMENTTITVEEKQPPATTPPTETIASPAAVIDGEKRRSAKLGITPDEPGGPGKIQVLRVVTLFLRFLTFVFSVGALLLVVTDRQAISANYFGIPFRAQAEWTSATAFEYEAAIAAVASLYSLVQLKAELFMCLLGKSAPRKYAWIQLLLDQVATYLLATSGAAAASLANLNLNGLKGAPLPVIHVCDFLHRYCYQAFLAVAFTFAAFVLSAHVVVLDIYFLCGK